MVRVLHRISGRVRFEVVGLRGSNPFAAYLEYRLSAQPGIRSASASATTGNVLVLFAATHTVEALAELIHDFKSSFQEDWRSPSDQAGSEAHASDLLPQSDTKPPWTSRMTGWADLKGPQEGRPWHTMPARAVARHFGTSTAKGLSDEDASGRLADHGLNVLPGTFRRPLGAIFTSHLSSVPVLLIAAAAGLSVLTGRMAAGLIGLSVTLVNVVIGSAAEAGAERSLEEARQAVDLRARVLRDGIVTEIPFEAIVVGDLLDLQLGSRIPADARLLETDYLSVDEATLTGESVPVRKSIKTLSEGHVPITGRRNMVYRGTLVVEGSGRAVVVATGKDTVLGRLQGFLGEVFPPEAAVAGGMKDVAIHLIKGGLVGSGIVAVISIARGCGLLRIATDSIAFLAWTLPSGLSTLALGAFALGLGRMRRERILVRRLRALGNLASIQMVCFDKTGTLTLNRMTVGEVCTGKTHLEFDKNAYPEKEKDLSPHHGPDIQWLGELSALCNEMAVAGDGREPACGGLEGSSTEKAMIELAERLGIDPLLLKGAHPMIEIRHRSDEHHFMITLHQWTEGRELTIVKGNPLEVMERCAHFQLDGKVIGLGDEERHHIEADNFRMAGSGLRVLGIAYRWGKFTDQEEVRSEVWQLVWVGMVGLADPLRKGAKSVVKALHRAGIKTVVITGDQSLTAHHIGEELGLSGDEPLRILDASDLKGLRERDMEGVVTRAHIFARLSPAQKLQIIQAYQRTGMGVVMVGDGINDVLALKVADVGIAMGRDGSDLARRTADLILEDDDLGHIMVAIANGRAFYGTLRRSLRFLLTANQVDILMELGAKAGVIGAGSSVWQNVWTNAVCLSLALSPPGVESEASLSPDPERAFVKERDIKGTFKGAMGVLAGGALSGFYGLARYGMGTQASRLFSTGVSINQLLYADTCQARPEQDPRGTHPNPYLRATTLGVVGWQILSLCMGGLGASLGSALSRTFDVAALGVSGFLTRGLLSGRSGCSAPKEEEREFDP